MEELLKGEIIRYAIIIATVFAVAVKVVQTLIYIRLMEESENVPASKNKLIKQMKLKFENCHKLNLGVNNVHIFVNKYMYKHKVGKISMYHYNRIPIVAAWLCGTAGIASGCICYLANYSVKMGALYEIYGIGSILILKLVDVILDTDYKRNVVYTNLVDFFENSLQNHLTHEVVNVGAITEEEREMLEEIPAISEVKRENKEVLLHYHKKDKNKKPDTETSLDSNAQAIIEDVLTQFLS
ncbi:hypothetical protein [Konateibacter massiliensis]|uniref:hypothetical protein n=1 Tax=Konateibacter massiliensis TaxID=2002841 RepID=UPI000C14C60D|nr:hypothetical protein [Konateibacter massiliensis]